MDAAEDARILRRGPHVVAAEQPGAVNPMVDGTMLKWQSVLYAVTVLAVIVGLDIFLFRHEFVERLIVNVGIVLVSAAFYLRFLRG